MTANIRPEPRPRIQAERCHVMEVSCQAHSAPGVEESCCATSVVQAPTRIIDASQSSWHDPEARVPSVPAYFVASATGK
ncbi:hypothetical protein R6Z07M_016039 [Ovis aries]